MDVFPLCGACLEPEFVDIINVKQQAPSISPTLLVIRCISPIIEPLSSHILLMVSPAPSCSLIQTIPLPFFVCIFSCIGWDQANPFSTDYSHCEGWVCFWEPASLQWRQERQAILLSQLSPWGQVLRGNPVFLSEAGGAALTPGASTCVCRICELSQLGGRNKHLALKKPNTHTVKAVNRGRKISQMDQSCEMNLAR